MSDLRSAMKIELDGATLTNRRLGELSQGIDGVITYKAVAAGGRFLADAIRNAAPVGSTGNLRNSIAYSIGRQKDGFLLTVGARWPQGAHVHLVEKGTQERFTKTGRSTGRMLPNPFIVPTFESRRGQFESAIADELAVGVEAEAA